MHKQSSLTALQLETHSLLNWYLSVNSASIDNEGGYRKWALAKHTSTCCRVLMESKPALCASRPAKQVRVTVKPFDPSGNRLNTFGAVDGLLKKAVSGISNFLTHGLFHGSLSDGQVSKGWSDVDSLLFIKDDVLLDPERLVRLREESLQTWPYLLRICRYQHHGFIFCGDFERDAYPSSYVPMEALGHAKRFAGPDEDLHLHVLNMPVGAKRNMESRLKVSREALVDNYYRHHPYNGRYLEINFRDRNDNMTQLFAYICYMLLVPCLCLEAMGRPAYKDCSFELVKDILGRESLAFLDILSSIRTDWENIENMDKCDNSIPDWLIDRLGERHMNRSIDLLRDAIGAAG